MANLSPKIEIINHFDNLINRIDIDIEKTIENYKDQVIGKLKCFQAKDRNVKNASKIDLEYFDSNESLQNEKCETVNEWSESTKVIDYLNQVRQKTIDELRKAQKDSLDYLKSKSCDLNQLKESKDIEDMKSRLFADKFYFQVLFNQNSWVFNLFTIVADFYLSPTELSYLEYLINEEQREKGKFYSDLIFDEKFALMLNIYNNVRENLKCQQYPNHVIKVHKRDLLSIKAILFENLENVREVNLNNYFSSYLSNLEYLNTYHSPFEIVRIERLSSLKILSISIDSIKRSHFGCLSSLKELYLRLKSEINKELLENLFEICPNIVKLSLTGQFSNINFDKFVNLKSLCLRGDILEGFNFDVFNIICNQLEELSIKLFNMDDESISKLLYGHNFPNLSYLGINSSKITRLEKKLFDRFPMLQTLILHENNHLKTIDKDAFSNLKNLIDFRLIENQLSELDPELFSCLGNLEKLNLANNNLTHFDLKIKDYIVNIKKIYLYGNPIVNKEEISNHFKQSKIMFENI